MKRKISKVCIVLLTLCLSVICFIPTKKLEAKTLRDYLNEMQKMVDEMADYEARREEARKRAKQYEKEISDAYANIEKFSNDIQAARKKIEELNLEIEAKEKEIQDLLTFLQLSNGENVYLEYVFGANSFTDFIFRTAVVEQLSNHNDELINEMNDLIEQNKELQKELEEKILQEQDAIKKQNELLKKINIEIDDIDDMYTDVEAEVAGLKEEIEYLENKGCDLDQDLTECLGIPYASGFYNPVKTGVVTSEFGYRVDPITGAEKVYHKGIDIALADWNPVYASAAGTVSTIVRKASCGGNIVYVKHIVNGVKYTTRYIHLSSINVSVGQTVNMNSIVGYSGGGWTATRNGGYDTCSTGAHLHFEINEGWLNEGGITPKNPRNYVYFPSRW